MLIAALLVSVGVIVGVFFAITGDGGAPEAKEFNSMVSIGAGTVMTADGSQQVAAFDIEQHEVTIAQYAAFLDALKSVDASKFAHRDQPEEKLSHVPESWDALYAAAKKGGTFSGQSVSLNHPVFLVDWWDAHAYARWKGRRLPTAAEWQLAALGESSERKFPWGKKGGARTLQFGGRF